jgi:hypothetical protein
MAAHFYVHRPKRDRIRSVPISINTAALPASDKKKSDTHNQLNGYRGHQSAKEDDSDRFNPCSTLYLSTESNVCDKSATYNRILVYTRPSRQVRCHQHDNRRYEIHLGNVSNTTGLVDTGFCVQMHLLQSRREPMSQSRWRRTSESRTSRSLHRNWRRWRT